MEKTLQVLNDLVRDGVLSRYAIGGAVGATFYLEPVATMDVDVFVAFRMKPSQSLLSLQPLYDYLTARGCTIEGESVVVAGWPVQFLPPTSPLVEEALAEASTVDVEGTPTRAFTAEHLAAISLQTGRAKDKTRLLQFIEAGALDANRLQAILARHGLAERWRQFQRQFLKEPS